MRMSSLKKLEYVFLTLRLHAIARKHFSRGRTELRPLLMFMEKQEPGILRQELCVRRPTVFSIEFSTPKVRKMMSVILNSWGTDCGSWRE